MNDSHHQPAAHRKIVTLPNLIFMSRWLQLPLYLGLILGLCVYVYQFWLELGYLVGAALGNADSLSKVLDAVVVAGAPRPDRLNEQSIMLVMLSFIDVVMIANLLIMVIVGGYEIFVSRLNLSDHPDQPEWLSHVNAAVLKVKLVTAIIGISSVHLLKAFFNASYYDARTLLAQVGIHIAFLLSALAIAYCERLMEHMQGNAHSQRSSVQEH